MPPLFKLIREDELPLTAKTVRPEAVCCGEVVPIPTFCEPSIYKPVVPPVCNDSVEEPLTIGVVTDVLNDGLLIVLTVTAPVDPEIEIFVPATSDVTAKDDALTNDGADVPLDWRI